MPGILGLDVEDEGKEDTVDAVRGLEIVDDDLVEGGLVVVVLVVVVVVVVVVILVVV